jgi:hypothetical protein
MPAMSAVVFTSTRSSGAGSAEGLGASSTVHSVPHQRPPSADAGRPGAHSRWPIRPWHITAMAPMMPQRLMGDWHYLVDGRISRGGRRLMLCSVLIRQLVHLPRRCERWSSGGNPATPLDQRLLGIDSRDYSFGYVATRPSGGEQAIDGIKASCERMEPRTSGPATQFSWRPTSTMKWTSTTSSRRDGSTTRT